SIRSRPIPIIVFPTMVARSSCGSADLAVARCGRLVNVDTVTTSLTSSQVDLAPFDSLLLLSFGGPEKPEDVVPFLKNVTAGRGIPEERLEEVGEHYYRFGGRSPINDQNRALRSALEGELAGRDADLPVYWGNRNFTPYL